MIEWTADDATAFLTANLGHAKGSHPPRLTIHRPAEEVIPGAVFHALVNYRPHGDCSARIYCGMTSPLGRTLWLQEAQSLVRLNATQHPALPRVIDGRFWDNDHVGVVISKATGKTLTSEDTQFLRENPDRAYRYFSLLADALRTLHDYGLVHRDIWRGSLEIVQQEIARKEDRQRPPSIRLVGFEMSAFTASLADPTWRVDDEDRRRLRESRRRGGHERVAGRAPEVLHSEEESGSEGLSYRSDVFSLGVLGFQWFVEDIPEILEGQPVRESPEAVASWIQKRLANADHVSEGLRDILREMVRIDARTRPTAYDIVNRLAMLDEQFAFTWSREDLKRPYLLTISPFYMRKWIQIEEWKNLPQDEDLFFDQLRTLIEKDLVNCILIHEPSGASSYVRGGDPQKQANSMWVLIGKRAVYFCEKFIVQRGLAQRNQSLSWILHINYVVNRDAKELRDIGSVPLRRRIRLVQIVHALTSPETQRTDRGPHPDWDPLLDEVFVKEDTTVQWLPSFRKGFEWWLKFQRARLDIRMYAFRRLPPQRGLLPDPRRMHLELDVERDRTWIESDDMRYLLSTFPRPRPSFGDFFGTLRERDAGTDVSWRAEAVFRSDSGTRTRGRVRRIGPNEIELEVIEGAPPAETGWMRPSDDTPSEIQLRRQAIATASLFTKPQLVEALFRPWSVRGPRDVWASAARDLQGRAVDIVKDLLAYFPFYALQGPPGTGKTTVLAHAVAAFVNSKPGARVLVSAQSHYALDELAERIIELLNVRGRNDLVVLRVAGQHGEENVRASMRDFFDIAQIDDRLKNIKSHLKEHSSRLEWDAVPQGLKKIAGEWLRVADKSRWEIQDRIWKGANLVFATCGTCTENVLGLQDGFDFFDWVIVEEAAKAWPAELVMPLVLGHRWTVIGDHKQLPPYGDIELGGVYQACLNSPRPELRDLVTDDEGFKATLELFRHFFEDLDTRTARPRASNRQDDQEGVAQAWPIDQLTMQFRMDDRILQIIREAFYSPKTPSDSATTLESAPGLRSATALHRVRTPASLTSRALAWLDTGSLKSCGREVGYWQNEGEARQVAKLLSEMKPSPLTVHDKKSTPIAVLSPYNQQIHLLKSFLKPELSPYVYTTDSFQGREADIVVVSLVRTNDAPKDDPLRRIGHVASAQRTNVLLSRARHLLIIVGDFNHFRDTVGTEWQIVCRVIDDAKARIELRDDQELG